jgi:hypothetical protein
VTERLVIAVLLAAAVEILALAYLIIRSLFVRLQMKHISGQRRFYPVLKPASPALRRVAKQSSAAAFATAFAKAVVSLWTFYFSFSLPEKHCISPFGTRAFLSGLSAGFCGCALADCNTTFGADGCTTSRGGCCFS